MNDKTLKKGIENVQKIALSSEEKQSMLFSISKYAEDNPISHHVSIKPVSKVSPFNNFISRYVIVSPYSRFLIFGKSRFVYVGLAIAVILVSSGTALAAGKSLPGDLLYPIKIQINEPVEGALKTSFESKVKWEGEKAVRRLEEAEKLVENDKLDEPRRADIEKEFEKSADAFAKLNHKKISNESKDKDDDKETVAELDFKIKVEQKLEKINKKKDRSSKEQEDQIKKLEKKVKEKLGKRD